MRMGKGEKLMDKVTVRKSVKLGCTSLPYKDVRAAHPSLLLFLDSLSREQQHFFREIIFYVKCLKEAGTRQVDWIHSWINYFSYLYLPPKLIH